MSSNSHSHADFVSETILKRDIFSETHKGHSKSDPSVKLALRNLKTVPWYARPVAQWLAQREARGLAAVQGIAGAPVLIAHDRDGILREWSEGMPLQYAKPDQVAWYRDARRLLRQMRKRGVAHNDLAKRQNWLVMSDGGAGVIDFQLAVVFKRPGRLARLAAREDLRHLIKQKRLFAPHLLTPSELSLMHRKSLPSRIWKATGKEIYNFVTRRLMNWRDDEGFEGRLEEHKAALDRAFKEAGAEDVAFASFPLSSTGLGLYAFVVGLRAGDAPQTEPAVNLVQEVKALPRHADGTHCTDILTLIANNQIDEARMLFGDVSEEVSLIETIIAGRLNLTDKHHL